VTSAVTYLTGSPLHVLYARACFVACLVFLPALS
jgi:hypothetical protein